jgi:hypothetical protein
MKAIPLVPATHCGSGQDTAHLGICQAKFRWFPFRWFPIEKMSGTTGGGDNRAPRQSAGSGSCWNQREPPGTTGNQPLPGAVE